MYTTNNHKFILSDNTNRIINIQLNSINPSFIFQIVCTILYTIWCVIFYSKVNSYEFNIVFSKTFNQLQFIVNILDHLRKLQANEPIIQLFLNGSDDS